MDNLARFLVDSEVLRFGQFTLKSGRTSSYFLNFGSVYTGPHLTRLGTFFADFLQERLPGGYDGILGPAYKGIPMAVATCQQLWQRHQVDVGYLSFRKEAKTHGEGGSVLGMNPEGKRLILIDDVMTSGATKVEALEMLRQAAPTAQLVAVVIAVDREEPDAKGRPALQGFHEDTGIPVLALARVSEIVATVPH